MTHKIEDLKQTSFQIVPSMLRRVKAKCAEDGIVMGKLIVVLLSKWLRGETVVNNDALRGSYMGRQRKQNGIGDK